MKAFYHRAETSDATAHTFQVESTLERKFAHTRAYCGLVASIVLLILFMASQINLQFLEHSWEGPKQSPWVALLIILTGHFLLV